MRETSICPKCHHDHVLYIGEVADWQMRHLKAAAIAIVAGASVGELCAFVCKRCGFVEHYVRDPQSIPVDGQQVVERVGSGPAPYR